MAKKTTKPADGPVTQARIAKMKKARLELKTAIRERKAAHEKFQKKMELSHKDTLKSMRELYNETEKRKNGAIRRHVNLKVVTQKNMRRRKYSKDEVTKARDSIEKQYRPDIEKAKKLTKSVLRSVVEVEDQIKNRKRERDFEHVFNGLEHHIPDMKANKEDLKRSQNKIDNVLKDAKKETNEFWAAFPSAIHPLK